MGETQTCLHAYYKNKDYRQKGKKHNILNFSFYVRAKIMRFFAIVGARFRDTLV